MWKHSVSNNICEPRWLLSGDLTQRNPKAAWRVTPVDVRLRQMQKQQIAFRELIIANRVEIVPIPTSFGGGNVVVGHVKGRANNKLRLQSESVAPLGPERWTTITVITLRGRWWRRVSASLI